MESSWKELGGQVTFWDRFEEIKMKEYKQRLPGWWLGNLLKTGFKLRLSLNTKTSSCLFNKNTWWLDDIDVLKCLFEWFVSSSLHPLFSPIGPRGSNLHDTLPRLNLPKEAAKPRRRVCGGYLWKVKIIISGTNELKSWKVTGRNLVLIYFDWKNQLQSF